ncbi:hypothetical protein ACJELJ_03805 [Legionella pneumophila]|nr:hypothetical protein [Legionella pneumophila]HAT1912078.1 hypothetical protein [Legionella pneumophila]HAT1915073.1 hypothetical protein [Legionella pneumophila]HAT1921552.1 hypothetical protein [Legionella pneumophila]HAT1930668.1 hypothetical protein [Legionella pneumophila]
MSYQAKYPEDIDRLQKDKDNLLAFCHLPAGHLVHLRATNSIESTF